MKNYTIFSYETNKPKICMVVLAEGIHHPPFISAPPPNGRVRPRRAGASAGRVMRALPLRQLRRHRARPPGTAAARAFATSYSGRIVREDPAGRAIAVEIDLPDILRDTRGIAQPRRDLICRVSRILQSPSAPTCDPFLELSDYLHTLPVTPTTSEVSEVLKALRSPEIALEFFHFCSSLPGYRHDCFTYNRLFSILSRSPVVDVGLVRRLLDEMEKEGVRGNISTVNILISIFGGVELGRCLELVKKWSLRFNRYTYKCLLQAYLRSLDVEKAFEVHEEMRRRGYNLDIFAYNMLLDALDKADKMTGKRGKSDEFLSYFHDMITKGFTLNLIAYNTIIQALARNHMVDKVFFVLSKMIENECRPNEFTYSVIIDGLAREGKLYRVNEIVRTCKKFINKQIYAYLVKTLSKLGYASEAHSVFCEMWNSHDKGDKGACMSMLEILCHAGKTLEAMDLLAKIHEKELSADSVMYNLVFSALGRLCQTSDINTLYEQMKNDGPSPDIFTYNILISSFGKAGQVDRALQLFEEMELNDCRPDVITYNSLINTLGKNGDLDEAHMRYKEMKERGLTPDVFTYSILIECFGKSNSIEMACKLFDEMLSEGCPPNIVTYNILLDCLEKCGKTAEAFNIYATLKQQGLTPDAVTYTIIERLQSRCHHTMRVRKESPITGWVVSLL
ncbi:hypothetical protein Taro_037249 [Colocasia esculenta]|uniref:Pentatricopeptide repeat-containing protein n=1 Tax=Colocasia esculenta TaxID=4460 RepID=A0A843VZY5_COLES|nr:hypothetical protein [Colocasia esculenta]